MALSVGSRLGHYDATALLGQGSMGEVYRARVLSRERRSANGIDQLDGRRHMMMRCLVLLAVCLTFPLTASAGPEEEAQAVFDSFLTAFSAANFEGVLGLFAPDALVWGTGMRDLATTPEPVRQYFSGGAQGVEPNRFRASTLGPASALVLSDDAVLVSGIWQVQRAVDGTPTVAELRISIAVVKRGDRWLIAQFHNSLRPAPQ
jgi:uncharacterized protein (TIGR02246 family)